MIRQATCLPLVYFATVAIGGMLAIDYSQLGQHVSELAVNERIAAKNAFDIGITVTGVSMILFGLGMILEFHGRFLVSALLNTLLGVTFLFGVVFPIGSPWHGAYGIGFSAVVLPVVFLYELGRENAGPTLKLTAAVATFILITYFWLIFANLYPAELRGLAQRVFGLALFGFMSMSAYTLGQLEPRN